MSETRWKSRKVTIVGAGAVGATFAYALVQSGHADEIVLTDLNRDLAEGHVLDLAHGLPYYSPVQIDTGSADDYADSHVIVITAGAGQKPGETRLDLLQRNAAIIESIMDEITSRDSQAVVVLVSNPVDVLTYVAQQQAKLPPGRVIGSGTVLDSARFRYLLSEHCGIAVHNVHGYILGEHGDSEFAAWSMTHLAGMTIEQYCPICGRCDDWDDERKKIEDQVRNSAYHIIDYKGATYFGVGMALVRIVGAILRSEHAMLTVSTLLNGEYGLSDVCLSVPCIVSEQGVERIIEAQLTPEELLALQRSGKVLQEALAGLRK